MKYLKKYLMISSVILHLVLVLSLFWAIPFITESMNIGEEWVKSMNTSESGVVKDVSEIVRDNFKYRGYWIIYRDQNLYTTSTGTEVIEKGDKVNIIVNKVPFDSSNTLLVTIMKKTP